MKSYFVTSLCLSLVFNYGSTQSIIDSCFTSATPVSSTNFTSSGNLANSGSADVIRWTGASWFGGFSGANLTIPPPTNNVNCRAIFVGNSSSWTTGGECFSLRLTAPLVAGQNYVFKFTTVSHGTGSTGNFSPFVYTNTSSAYGGAYSVGNIAPAGTSWTTSLFSFTATAAQAGHQWLIIGTKPNGTSGLVNSFCSTCNIPTSLSIELLTFGVTCLEDEVVLNWITETETDNDYFTIEKSRDGKTFEEVQTIQGNGTSNTKKYYSFVDKNKLFDKFYYRLSQTDFNGDKKYVAIQIVNCNQEKEIEIYPNPFSDQFYVSSRENATITIRDMMGKTIHEQHIEVGVTLINSENLIKGSYISVITFTNGKSIVEKIIKY